MAHRGTTEGNPVQLEKVKSFCRREGWPYREALADAKLGRLVVYRPGKRWMLTTEPEWRRYIDSKRLPGSA